MTLDDINEIAPKHGRTSCADDASSGNEYFNEYGYVRCVRCAFLYRLKEGHWPHNGTVTIPDLLIKR